MAVTGEFVTAWRNWQQSIAPYAQDSSREIEYELSHMDSNLYGMGVDAIAGKRLPFGEIARRELSDLDALIVRLDNLERSDNDKEALRKHMRVIRSVWSAIENLVN